MGKILSCKIFLLILLILMTGCTNAEKKKMDQPTNQPEVSEKQEDGGNTTHGEVMENGDITLMASQNWIKEVDRALFEAFQEETGIEVKVLLTPDNGYATLLGTSLSGGGDAVDLFMYAAGAEMASAGIPDVALDLSGEPWIPNMEPWAIKANTYDGKLIGHSTWGIDFEGVLYNRTYFKENGLEVPTTWEAFIELLDKVKALGKTPLYENINGVWHTQSWLYAMTPPMLEENPNYILELNQSPDYKFASSSVLKQGLSQLYDLFSAKEEGKPKYYTNDGQSEDWFGSFPSLVNRETVMLFTYSAYAAQLADKGSTDEWGMFPLPVVGNTQCVSNGGGISKFINKNSGNIEACKLFLAFLSRDENLEKYYAGRPSLISSAFKEVESVKPTTATIEAIERSGGADVPIMMLKDIMYWDPDIYKYFQGFIDESISVEQFINNMDNYRKTMYEATES